MAPYRTLGEIHLSVSGTHSQVRTKQAGEPAPWQLRQIMESASARAHYHLDSYFYTVHWTDRGYAFVGDEELTPWTT